MPVYEYKCKDCGKDFEKLVSKETKMVCDHCGGENVVKKLSLFASKGHASPAGDEVCGCGLGPEERAAKKRQCGCG